MRTLGRLVIVIAQVACAAFSQNAPEFRSHVAHYPSAQESRHISGIVAQKNHLWSSPVVFPFFTYLDVLRQSSAAYKALQILKSSVLKRLASAVQLRPWPPCFQSVRDSNSSFLAPIGSTSARTLRRDVRALPLRCLTQLSCSPGGGWAAFFNADKTRLTTSRSRESRVRDEP